MNLAITTQIKTVEEHLSNKHHSGFVSRFSFALGKSKPMKYVGFYDDDEDEKKDNFEKAKIKYKDKKQQTFKIKAKNKNNTGK